MVIRDSHLVGVAAAPLEAGSIPILDADTVLAPAIALEGFEPVAWQGREIAQLVRGVDRELSVTMRNQGKPQSRPPENNPDYTFRAFVPGRLSRKV